MPSVHRVPRSPYWYAAIYLPDGRRTMRSTKQTERKKAQAISLKWDQASKVARDRRLSVRRARKFVADCYEIVHQDQLPSESTEDFLASWLNGKEGVVADSSHVEYAAMVRGLLEYLGARAKQPMDTVSAQDLLRYRSQLKKRVAPATVNKALRILGGAWRQAQRDGIVSENIFEFVDRLSEKSSSKRRAFTMNEIERVLALSHGEWRGMILTGLYTGLRLRDVAELTWQEVDPLEKVIWKTTRKTGQTVDYPMHETLVEYFVALSVPDDPLEHVFPDLARLPSNTLSHQFSRILADAGMVTKKPHRSSGRGRSARREASPLSFHCLRHTNVTWLKNRGVSDAIAKDLLGHGSDAVSRRYTHIDIEAKRDAVSRLPRIQ